MVTTGEKKCLVGTRAEERSFNKLETKSAKRILRDSLLSGKLLFIRKSRNYQPTILGLSRRGALYGAFVVALWKLVGWGRQGKP